MERKGYIRKITASFIMGLCCLSVPESAGAQKRYGAEIYRAYIEGDMDRWQRVISALESSGTPTLGSKLELAEYYYAHIGYLLGNGDKNRAKEYTDRAEALVGEILREAPGNPTATSLKGIFTAYRMEMNRIKAPVLGPQCMKLIRKAYKTDPANVQAVSDMGNMYYHCPAVFGGDKNLGLQYLRQAVALMEQRGEDSGNWFYLNLLAMVAQYEAETGMTEEARQTYEKILSIEPGFVWVRDELYPALTGSL